MAALNTSFMICRSVVSCPVATPIAKNVIPASKIREFRILCSGKSIMHPSVDCIALVLFKKFPVNNFLKGLRRIKFLSETNLDELNAKGGCAPPLCSDSLKL